MTDQLTLHCVYLITCSATGKEYVGLTKVGATKRFKAHVYNAKRGHGGALYAAMRKHGTDAFSVSVLADGLTVDQAQEREIRLIAERGCRAPHGYNIALGGEQGLLGVTLSDDTRARMSAAHSLRQQNPELRARTSAALRGRQVSDETREKLRAANTGRKLNEETKAKVRAANLGKKQSAETVAKRSRALKGIIRSDEVRASMSRAQRGVPKSPEHRAALSDALKGRKLSPETLAKRAATLARKRAGG